MFIFNKMANFSENLSYCHWNNDIYEIVFKAYRFKKRAFLLAIHGVNWRQHRRNCRIGKIKTNKMVFSTEDLVLIKVLRQEKGYHNGWIITQLQWR